MRKTALAIALGLGGMVTAVAGGAAPARASAVQPSVTGMAVVQTAMEYLGLPYATVGHAPSTGFSDVGFVSYVFGVEGVSVPRSRGKLLKLGPHIAMTDLQPGDILYFQNTVWRGLSHIGIYAGNGTFVHSEWYGYGVRVTSLTKDTRDGDYWASHYLAANRILPVSGPAAPTMPPASVTQIPKIDGQAIVTTALKYVGAQYVAHGSRPDTGFDPIGFVQYVYASQGVKLPSDYSGLAHAGQRVKRANLQPGDLILFKNTVWAGLSHVGIYVGGGRFIHAEWYRMGVRVTSFKNDAQDGSYWTTHYQAAVRL